MDNYPYNSSYPESGDSSPRSREIEFENPPPWEDSQGNQPPSNYKVKFMCSYGGKIHPRPHDNQLSYVGGETKILSVDRNIKFGSLLAKLIGLCESENISFKYQLPGEDLDALISVTNDDDLEHMMHEYERLYRISPKPARLRIFIFPTLNQSLSSSTRSFGSVDEGRSEKERFVEALNSAPIMTTPPQSASPVAAQPQPATSNVDFLFGLEKSNAMAAQPPAQRQVMGRVPDAEDPVFVSGSDERFAGLDPIQKHIQDLQGLQRLRLEEQQGLQRLRLEEQQGLQRLRLEEQEGIHRRKSEDNIPGGGYAGGGEYYKAGPEKAPQAVIHGGVPYWTDKQVPGGVIPASGVSNNEQAVYMMPAPANVYHSPMVRPMAGAPQGFYTVQRLPSEMYRDQQQMYNMIQQQSTMPSMAAAPPPLQPQKAAGYSEGFAMVRPGTTGGVGVVTEAGYGQMPYDGGMGRQVIYTTPGGVMAAPPQVQAAAQYQAMAGGVNTTDMRQGGALNQEAAGGFKGVQKVTQGSL